MASVEWNNKKNFFKFVNIKTGSRENIGPILVEDGHITNIHGENVETFNVSFICFFFSPDLIISVELEPPGPEFS